MSFLGTRRGLRGPAFPGQVGALRAESRFRRHGAPGITPLGGSVEARTQRRSETPRAGAQSSSYTAVTDDVALISPGAIGTAPSPPAGMSAAIGGVGVR